jgi:hypothetical protein
MDMRQLKAGAWLVAVATAIWIIGTSQSQSEKAPNPSEEPSSELLGCWINYFSSTRYFKLCFIVNGTGTSTDFADGHLHNGNFLWAPSDPEAFSIDDIECKFFTHKNNKKLTIKSCNNNNTSKQLSATYNKLEK